MQTELYLMQKRAKEQRNQTAYSDAFLKAIERKEAKRNQVERNQARKAKRFMPSAE
jgi:hypothetical protein